MAKYSAADLERIAKDWQAAFAEAHSKPAPAVIWEKGWFKIGGTNRKYRREAFEEMTAVLRKGFTD